MPKIDTESERERLDRIFDEIAGKIKTKEQRHAIYERNRRKATAPDHCWRCSNFTDCSMSESRNCERWRHEK